VQRERLVAAKRRGEAALRNSGLGYTIVRPGPLVEEAGGYKALVFDQGNRITQGISCADVADVCLKALRNPEARNKTFEVGAAVAPGRAPHACQCIAACCATLNAWAAALPPPLLHRCALSTSRRRGWNFTSSFRTCQVRKQETLRGGRLLRQVVLLQIHHPQSVHPRMLQTRATAT
jgi:nucleoside-diphosphate-sugar epimerase